MIAFWLTLGSTDCVSVGPLGPNSGMADPGSIAEGGRGSGTGVLLEEGGGVLTHNPAGLLCPPAPGPVPRPFR